MAKIVNTTMTIKLKNDLSLTELKESVFLKKITKRHTRTRYKNSFNAVSWSKPETEETITMYANGKVVILGCKSLSQGNTVSSWLLTNFPGNSLEQPLKLHNIVAHGRFNTVFDIPETIEKLRARGRDVFYEPDLSAPMKYHIDKATCLLFQNGKAIFTGVKTEEQLHELVNTLENDLGIKIN